MSPNDDAYLCNPITPHTASKVINLINFYLLLSQSSSFHAISSTHIHQEATLQEAQLPLKRTERRLCASVPS